MATMDDLDKLPSDLVWQPDGHLSEIALTSIADGEADIVPLEAHSHLEHCDDCTTRFGAEALLSMHAGELLAEVSRAAEVPAVLPPHAAREADFDGLAKLPKSAFLGGTISCGNGSRPGDCQPRSWAHC